MKQSPSLKKMFVTALLAALAYVLNTVVVFPAMAPFQHFVNVLTVYPLGLLTILLTKKTSLIDKLKSKMNA
ncbi:hypothetical protein LQZ24_02835 [Fructobacillus sp. M1-13]|uniref:hypothetical protein n=1 Tax=Fructobacillus papyriferae TaxID=2713171 RepID=UPI001BD3C7D9|nr:hypothetical protein [Fructobacillus papyriferae]MCD2158967.1 hypothetical protein [Fructobacillus papyriferae]